MLGPCSPCPWLELASVLAECVVEGPWVWESLSGSNEFYHLSALCDFNGLGFVLGVGRREWCSYDLVQNAGSKAV
jgi:hypothetical protein